jgi:hypothetical protein
MSFVRPTVIIAAALLCVAFAARAPATQGAPRVVAIGDIHGALDSLTAILQAAGLTDTQGRWIGGRTRVVQTGDYLDRGAAVRGVLELLMRLEEEAKRAGGRVEVLFGNHEGMNVMRDLRDVSPDALASFADRDSEARRSRAFIAHATIARRAGQELNRNNWLKEHPPGYIEYLEAMGPSGRFGRWIRSRKVVTKIGDTVFMHAGIPIQSTATLDDVNTTVEREVRAFDDAVTTLQRTGLIGPAATLQDVLNAAATALNDVAALLREQRDLPSHVTQEYVTRLQALLSINQWLLTAPEGALWYRGFATLSDDALPQIDGLLKRLGAARFAVGHTPQLPGRINARFGGRVFLIDTGMLTTYYKGGRPSALEMAGGRITAMYIDQRETLQPEEARPK